MFLTQKLGPTTFYHCGDGRRKSTSVFGKTMKRSKLLTQSNPIQSNPWMNPNHVLTHFRFSALFIRRSFYDPKAL